MAANKIFTLFMVLFLTQALINAKPVEDTFQFYENSEKEARVRANPTPEQKLLLHAHDNFVNLSLHYANNADYIANNVLKDESLLANDKPEVLEFKNKLSAFVAKYESNRNPDIMWDIIDMYTDAVDKYYHIPEDKVTPESSFILELLRKHKGTDVATRFVTEFKKLDNNFVNMFEENKEHLAKPILDWYENFKTLNDIEAKIDAFGKFFDLYKKEKVM